MLTDFLVQQLLNIYHRFLLDFKTQHKKSYYVKEYRIVFVGCSMERFWVAFPVDTFLSDSLF